MLKFMHKHNNSLLGFVVIAAICLVMTGFGVDFLGGGDQETYAIKVNDQTVSYGDFNDRREQLQNLYRQRFGANFYQIMESLKIDLNQQVIDRAISDTLVSGEARSKELFVGDNAVRDTLQELIPGGFSSEAYSSLLRRIGKTPAEFEEQLRNDLLRSQYGGLLRDASRASRREARVALERAETVYAVDYVEVDPASLGSEVADPSDEELEAFYTDRETDFEQPAKVSYEYVVFDPVEFMKIVDVDEEDVELYYVDNERDFRTPKRLKASHIQLNFAQDADEDAKLGLQAQAEQAHIRALAGEDFKILVEEFSDDSATKSKGGELGWIQRGKMAKAFDEVAFAVDEPGVLDLVKAPYGFNVIKIEEIKAPGTRSLESVRTIIEQRVKTSLAPAYARERAEILYEATLDGEKALSELASTEKLTSGATEGLLVSGSDPEGLTGLTRKVLESPGDERQVVDLGSKTLVVSVTKYLEPSVLSFKELGDARAQVIQVYTSEQVRKLAQEKVEKLIAETTGSEKKSLKLAADTSKIEVQQEEAMSRAKQVQGVLARSPLREAVYRTMTPMTPPREVLELGGKFYALQVTSITIPQNEEAEKKILEFRERESSSTNQLLFASIQGRLKAEADIDIDLGLMSDR